MGLIILPPFLSPSLPPYSLSPSLLPSLPPSISSTSLPLSLLLSNVTVSILLCTVDRATPFVSPAASHFMACLKRFGSPVICLNLVKV